MEKLVFTETALLHEEPFTTSEVIAEQAGVSHHAIQQLISRYDEQLSSFGKVAHEMRASNKVGSRQKVKIYHLNEPQATLLITFLQNTKPVVEFKQELVWQFYVMKNELMKRQTLREMEHPTRQALTDAIKKWSYVNKWSYKQITDLICKTITGKNTKQIKQERNVSSDVSGTDIYNSEEMAEYESLENTVITLLGLNMTYEQIKAILNGEAVEFTVLNKKEALKR
ncbi:Rha family transcriptional regulator [Tetragenococcus halophilus]